MQRYRRHFSFGAIFVLGLSLRLFQLGSKGFWVDELGVAKAAFSPTLQQAVAVARSHVMAMPMDYIVTWAMGRFTHTEGWLRLPAAMWGTFTLPAAFLLYRQMISRRSAMMGVFLLAFSPILIVYSQELRFYAPLVFFYTMASALGLRAVRCDRAGNWIAFVAVTIAGVFFHLFVIFAFTNVVLFSMTYHKDRAIPLRALLISFFVILMVAVIAVVQFGSLAGEHASLFAFESAWQVILGGLGFLPLFSTSWTAYIFGAILLFFTLLGLYRAGKIVSVGIAIIVQIGVILALDAQYNYFASARQLLMLLPLAGVFTARGLSMLLVWLNRRLHKFGSYGSRSTVHAGMMFFLLIVAGFVIVPYYHTEKTSTRAILERLETTWEPGELVLVTPDFNLPVYLYYAPWLKGDLHPFNQDDLENATFVISSPNADLGTGFERLYEPPTSILYPQMLWIKK